VTDQGAGEIEADLWAANVVEGRWLVDPAVSFVDRELELACMQLSNSLPPELWKAYVEVWPPDSSYEQRRPALQLRKFLNNIRHFGPDRCVPPSARSSRCPLALWLCPPLTWGFGGHPSGLRVLRTAGKERAADPWGREPVRQLRWRGVLSE
jgi:hypothetical protein